MKAIQECSEIDYTASYILLTVFEDTEPTFGLVLAEF